MKIIFFVLFLYGVVFGSVVDDYYAYKGQEYYIKGDLKNAFIYYEKIENKSDEVVYNMGNILYQTHNYKAAIMIYEKITSLKLLEKKWYNLANSYAQMKQYSKALYYYKKLLQKQNDKDAKANLLLVQKQIQKEYLKTKKTKKAGKKYEASSKDLFEDSKIESTKMVEGKNSNIAHKENISHLLLSNQKGKIYFKDIPVNLKLKILPNTTKERFTPIEEQKWDNLLKKKRMNSLIIPLNKKGVLNEDIKYPW